MSTAYSTQATSKGTPHSSPCLKGQGHPAAFSVKVDPRYTSQVCSSCGTVRKKTLDERWHSCECGCELDRDHNAARNIKALWLGRSHQEAQAS